MVSSNPAVKKQPEHTVAMFGYYVPYWLIVVVVIVLLAILHQMNVVNMGAVMPHCNFPAGTTFIVRQTGGAMDSALSPASALLPNVNSTEFM